MSSPLPVPSSMVELLNEPLPPEAIGSHPTKGFLSTIKTIFQIERLNRVFGVGGWTAKSEIIENSGAMVILKVTLKVPEYGIDLEQYGGNDNPDKGDAYKGAFTDALSKICGYLGIGMAVYKGEGPTKGNPAGKPQSNWKENREQKGQEAKARMAQRAAEQAATATNQAAGYEAVTDGRPVFSDEPGLQPPHDKELRDSIKEFGVPNTKKTPKKIDMLKAFGDLKKRFAAMKRQDAYYATLGAYGAIHSSDFSDTPAGIKQARECYNEMRITCADLEAEADKAAAGITSR